MNPRADFEASKKIYTDDLTRVIARVGTEQDSSVGAIAQLVADAVTPFSTSGGVCIRAYSKHRTGNSIDLNAFVDDLIAHVNRALEEEF